jgi:ABC-type branched-subunit amino acid transport system substrate-binding protein
LATGLISVYTFFPVRSLFEFHLALFFGEQMGFHEIAKHAKEIPVMLLPLLLTVPACSVKPGGGQENVIIGAIFPRGTNSYYEGINAVNGMHVAREEINHSGGILGKNLDVIVLLANDIQSDALQQYAILRAKGVTAIMTLTASEVAATLKQTAERDGMPIVDLNLALRGSTADRTNFNFSPAPPINGQEHNNVAFVNKFTSLFHFEPTRTAAASYETTHMLCRTIKTVGNTNKDDIISAINRVQPGE